MSQTQLRVTVDRPTTSGHAPVIEAAGEVDIQTSPLLERELQSVLDEGHHTVVVDLAGVTFLDSTGLSVLVGGLRRCETAGGELRVVSPRPNVRKVLEITGLVDAFGLGDEGRGTTPG